MWSKALDASIGRARCQYLEVPGLYLRLLDRGGLLIPSESERAEQERERAEQERERRAGT